MIQNELNRASQLKAKLVSVYNIKVIDDWLTGCVSFFMQENPKISNDGLFKAALEQWLLANLTEVGVTCLPDTIVNKVEMFILDGKYPLQLQYVMDISEPCYEQLRNLYNKKLDEADDEVRHKTPSKKKRMLKMELTDGSKTVIAMEHSPISCLNTKITPGTKILLTGPIKCINKVLFLEPKNVKILGGEVDVLLITNAFENILLKALGKPLNPNPKTEYDEVVVTEQTNKPKPAMQHVPMVFPSPARPVRKQSEEILEDDDMFLNIDLDVIQQEAQQKPPTAISHLMDDDDDFEMMNAIEDEMKYEQKISLPPQISNNHHFDEEDDLELMNSIENEMKFEQKHCLAPQPRKHAYTDFEPDDVSMGNEIENKIRQESATPKPKKQSKLNFNRKSLNYVVDDQKPSTSKSFDVSALFDDSMEDVSMEERKTVVKPSFMDAGYSFKINGHNLLSIDQIFTLQDEEKDGKCLVVFCEIDTIVDKLQIKNQEWSLGIYLSDRSSRLLHVRMKSDVIAKLVGHTAKEMADMRKLKDQNPKIVEEMTQILAKFKDKLQEMQSFAKLSFCRTQEYPIIVEIIAGTLQNKTILRNKINKENLTHLNEIVS